MRRHPSIGGFARIRQPHDEGYRPTAALQSLKT